MNYLRLADIITQVFSFVPSSVTCPVSSWRQSAPQPATIFVPLYIFFTHPFDSHSRLEVIGWRVYWLGFASRPVSLHGSTAQLLHLVGHLAISRLLETTHHTQSEFGDLNVKIPQCAYSAVLLIITDSLPFLSLPEFCFIFLLIQSHFQNLHPRFQITDISASSPSLSFPTTLFSDFRDTTLVLPSASSDIQIHTLCIRSFLSCSPSLPAPGLIRM